MGQVVTINAAKNGGKDKGSGRKSNDVSVKDRMITIKSGGGDEITLPEDFVRYCLNANEKGDGDLFAVLNRDKFIFNSFSKDDWYFFNGINWEKDIEGIIYGAVEKVVAAYAPLLEPLYEQMEEAYEALAKAEDREEKAEAKAEVKMLQSQVKKIENRIKRLRSIAGRKNCLEAARTGIRWQWKPEQKSFRQIKPINIRPLSITANAFDTHPMLLPVANGVIDLETGKLLNSRADYYLVTASPVEFQGMDAPCPVFQDFLLSALGNDQELVDYLQRLIGCAIIGDVIEHIYVVLYGARGRNGKTTFVECMYNMLGPLAGPIQSEMLLAQKYGRNSAGPSPDLMSLKGKRLVCASETSEGSKFDVARVKELTGGDRLQARNSYDKVFTEWAPSHTLFSLTNTIPHAPAQDIAFKKRLRLIKFMYSFVPDPKEEWERQYDPTLKKRLAAERPGILAWAVKGCLLYQQHGLADPPQVLKQVEDYMDEEDVLQEFIDECCHVDESASETVKELYRVFKMWWRANVGKNPISKNLFSRRMKLKIGKKVHIHGYPTFLGLCLRGEYWEDYFSG